MERMDHSVQILTHDTADAPTRQPQNKDITPLRSTKPPLLIVDDIRLTVRITQRALSSDWSCEVASDGLVAVQMAEKNVYRVILMDVNLPKMNGTEATEAIRKNEQKKRARKPVTIFGLTASFDDEDLDIYAKSGMDGCIAKGSVLRRAVQSAVQANRAEPDQFVFVDGEGLVHHRNRSGGIPDGSPFPPKPLRMASAPEQKGPISPISPISPTGIHKPDEASAKIVDVDATDEATYRRIHGDGRDFRKQMYMNHLAKRVATKTPPEFGRIPRMRPKEKSDNPRHYSKACLLVDDNPLTVKVTTRAVKNSGMQCDVAVDGEMAVQKAFKNRYQLILMDVMLPGFDGCEATQRIRNHEKENHIEKNTPIFGLTGSTDKDDLMRYAESGMDGCIQKGATIKTAIKDAISILNENESKFVYIDGKNVHSLPCDRMVS